MSLHPGEVGWFAKFNARGAFWEHDGNLSRPHALLTTSGTHSSGFFNSELVMEDPGLLGLACLDIVYLLEKEGICHRDIDRVVGPAMGAITLAHALGRRTGSFCAYTEKDVRDGKDVMVFKRTRVLPREMVLLCEDVLTTGKSVCLTADAVTDAGGILLPFVVVLVNRSGLKEVEGRKIIALIDRLMPMWSPEKCPLCEHGSEALRPKQGENWARLNAVR